ncbi:hypothetical protein PHYSODRAFT_294372 [Phytophthora sojae]|uniref:Protein kinase domain-containing protein n=1 Tax=Phytophthora sojae (strain P6497) TaxID=1094619 RepID=G4YGC5_PHYSP|nr:hypothetical protein PHYSODRAFT_294372 [Phytophthora sojae]EGZ29038.1 hypothetical protein PHYSODRAFT_294372 [Phytophthora sojae]|eukprot:XP_009516313.1 hypothetical protein PHYSODRAFT_294372 [Phytophthora sojae]
MVSVAHLLVPGRTLSVPQALATCEQQCAHMREAQPACQHLHSRLVDIFDTIHRRSSVGNPHHPEVLMKFAILVSSFVDFLERYDGQSLVYRVIKQPSIVDELREINEKIGEVFNSVGMVTTMSWKEQFGEDIGVLKEVLAAMARDGSVVSRELKGARAREEALLMLKFELEQREEQHGEDLVLLIRTMMETVGEASSATLSAWFVPLYCLEVEVDPFARGSFGSVHRGVWGWGVAVVVKRVQIDDMKIGEGVQRKIAREVGKMYELNHPNLIKMHGASHVGSPPYLRAPECLRWQPTFASDVYSLGMCIIAAEIGQSPFALLSDDDVRDNLRRGEIPGKPDSMAANAWELVVSMTKANPTERVSLGTVIDRLQVLARVNSAELSPMQPVVHLSASQEGSRLDADSEDDEGRVSSDQESSSSFDWSGAQSPVSSPVLPSDNFSVSTGLSTLTKGSFEEQESTLMRLIQACLDPEQRRVLEESNGFPVLVEMCKYGSTAFIQVCALGCLGWCTELDCSFPESEFEDLQEHVCNSNSQDYSDFAADLRHTSASAKRKAVIYCACVAEARGSEALQDAGVVAPLVALLSHSDEAVALWAMNAVGNMADNDAMKDAFAREGAIASLLELIKTGTNDQAALAAYALGRLASDHDGNNAAIVGSGAISCLIELLSGDTDTQKNFAAFALEILAEGDNEANWSLMANGGAIPALIDLLRTGTSIQKSHAANTLGSLANSDENCVRIARKRVIPDLVSLFQRGTPNQKERAVGALHFLSRNAEDSERMVDSGAIAVLVGSLESGTAEQREHALVALGGLASNKTENGEAIVENGAIHQLKEILRTGTEVEQGIAAFTLGLLSNVSNTIRQTIADAEAMRRLAQLLPTVSGEEKDQVMSAVCFLTDHGNGDLQAITSETIVPHLVEFVKKRCPNHESFAATVLGRFASDESFRSLIGAEGGIPPLVKLLRTGNAANKEKAAIALGRLAVGNSMNKSEMAISFLKNLCRTGSRQLKRSAATALAELEGGSEPRPRQTRRRVGA